MSTDADQSCLHRFTLVLTQISVEKYLKKMPRALLTVLSDVAKKKVINNLNKNGLWV